MDAPIDTVLNNVKELVDIATSALNSYTDQHYINLAYNIINKTGRYKIDLREFNLKDTAGKKWDALKPHFLTADLEFKDVDDKTVLGAGFQSANIVAQVVEGVSNVLHPTYNDN